MASKKDTGFLQNLINVYRFSGVNLIKSESVSDHVWSMNCIALSIVPEINKIARKSSGYSKLDFVNLKELIYKITIHDIDESLYCDIPKPFKYYDAKIHNAIESTANKLMSKNLGKDLYKDIVNAKDSTTEGLLVRFIDILQVAIKLTTEYRMGNTLIVKNLDETYGYLDSYMSDLREEGLFPTEVTKYMNELYETLKNERKRK
jgi:5'-deoxynucleotidase YfbR-like HD superfamily hydrolase